MFLKNVVIHKTIHIQEINIRNRVYSYYFNNLAKEKKSNLIDEKNYEDFVIYFATIMFIVF